MLDTIASVFVPIHKEGHKFIGAFALVTVLMFIFLPDFFGWLGVVLRASWGPPKYPYF